MVGFKFTEKYLDVETMHEKILLGRHDLGEYFSGMSPHEIYHITCAFLIGFSWASDENSSLDRSLIKRILKIEEKNDE